jgi:hypothetical protein
MSRRLRNELRFLRLHALVSTPLIIILVLSAFQTQQRARFDVIDVERINVVEPDGSYRLVISNRPRSDGPIYKGEPFGYPGGTRPGMIFNDEGTENGGMTFTGSRQDDGTYQASSHFAFDQFDQDQVLYLNYADNNGRRRLGLTVADRAVTPIFDLVQKRDSIVESIPEGSERQAALEELMGPVDGQPMFAQRVYVGRTPERAAVVNLSDPQGRTRIRMMVDSVGTASLEFLDEEGEVVARLPDGD